jgi:pyruvate kinase
VIRTPHRRTKIVCTLGPSTDSIERLRELTRAGADVLRLNAAHGSPEEHRARIARVRRVGREAGRALAILLDLPGPKLRLGKLDAETMELARGGTIVLSSRSGVGVLPVRIPGFSRHVRAGEPIALADGGVRLRVERIEGERVRCRVEVGGTIRSGSGVNLPDSELAIRLPTREDLRWIEFGLREHVDWIGVSFVRSARDVETVRRRLGGAKDAPAVLAKIEKRSALDDLDAVIAAADGVMVARGDLGVETPLAEVPIVQKRVIAAAMRLGRPVVTATQMLESMVENPMPTRAEVGDVANAVLDGTDAVMLSAETAIGRHPCRAVEVLHAVTVATERQVPFGAMLDRWEPGSDRLESALSTEACRLAGELGARALLVPATSLGRVTALSRLRPEAPILAFTDSEALRRRLAIVWGVEPLALGLHASLESRLRLLRGWLEPRGLAGGGSAVLLSTSGLGPARLDTLRVVELAAPAKGRGPRRP